MRIHTIQPAVGATTSSKRLGRGIGSGLGKTSGKGHKGQWARSGGGVRPASKADKLLSQDVCPNVVSTTSLL